MYLERQNGSLQILFISSALQDLVFHMRIFQSTRFFVLFSLTLLLVKLWLVSAHYLMATVTPHDDLLFITQANNILGGKWLGEYNQLTLIKGQFYPIFIALCYWLNIPLLAAQQLLYGLASFVTIWAVYPIVRQKWLLYVLFILLILNPFSYNYPAVGRVFRLAIYGPLALLAISCLIGLFVRSGQSWKKCAVWSIGAGLFLAAFWNTREESIWIAPSLLLLLILAFSGLRRVPRSRATLLAGLYLVPLVILFGANFTLKTINKNHYGVPETIELETSEFKAAYGGLLRIKSDKWQQYYPVVSDVREKVYAVSPTFREVQPFLDGDLGQKWQDLCGCDDLPAAFFIWALRDSVAAAGYHKDGPSTLQFYQKIGDEIDQACTDGKLDCRPRLTSLVPPWHQEYNSLLLPTYFSILKEIVSFRGSSAKTKGFMSQGPREIMQMFEVVTRERLLTSQPEIMRGPDPRYHSHLNSEKTKILSDIGTGYKVFIPVLFMFAFVIFLFIGSKSVWRRDFQLFTVVSTAALTGILSIAFILTLLTITSYSEIARAMHASYPMVLLFIISNLLDLFSRIPARDSVENESVKLEM